MHLRNGKDLDSLKEDIIEFWENLQECAEEAHDKVETVQKRQRFYPGEPPEHERIDLYEMVGKLKTCQLIITLFLDVFTDIGDVFGEVEDDDDV